MALIALTKTSTEFGEISIVQNRIAGSHVYWQEGWPQSEADRNGVSLAAYVHAIFGLVAQTPAHEMLMIGCGGGTLGTMLAHTGRSVTVVDINPQSIALARQYFCLPEHVKGYVEDGESFLKCNATVFDTIIIDAFVDAKVPHHLRSVDFFRLVRERLALGGCVFMNVYLRHCSDLSADVIAARMVHGGFDVRVLPPAAMAARSSHAHRRIPAPGTVAAWCCVRACRCKTWNSFNSTQLASTARAASSPKAYAARVGIWSTHKASASWSAMPLPPRTWRAATW